MPLTPKPLQRELSEIVTGYPDLDAMLKQMYADIRNAAYQGDPTETLQLVEERWEAYRQLRETPDYLDLVWEEPFFNFDPFDATPQETAADGDDNSKRTVTTSEKPQSGCLSPIMERAEPSLGVGLSPGKGKWVRYSLQSPKKTVDLKPNRLGPAGTWINEPDDEKNKGQITIWRPDITAAPLRRQDTLTD